MIQTLKEALLDVLSIIQVSFVDVGGGVIVHCVI